MDCITAEQVLSEIVNSPNLELNNVKITGDLNLNKIYIVYSSIRIRNSIIEGSLNFDGVHFKSKISFEDVIFTKDIRFVNTKFDENLELIKSSFYGSIYLGSIIYGNANFNRSKFIKGIYIINTRFMKKVSFLKTRSLDDVYISDSIFSKEVTFEGSYFKSKAFFKRLLFQGEAQFKDVLYGKDAIFDNSIFEKNVYFNDSFFGGMTGFRETKFLKDAYFYSEKSTPIGVAFSNKVDLCDVEFARLFIKWDDLREDKLIFNKDVMIKLINNFERISKPDEADACYYYYRNFIKNKQYNNSRMFNQLNRSAAYDWLEWAISGYGVKQLRVIMVLFILTTIFGIIFWFGNGVYSNTDIGNSSSIWTYESLAKSFIFSAVCLFAKIPIDLKATGYFSFIAIFESILGWLVLAIFISNLIEYNQRKKKRI